jgi:Uma2 family endonuclease
VQEKMQEYLDNGARLGWLIDPSARQVYVYRPSVTAERVDDPSRMSGDPELLGFVLELMPIWEPLF